MIREAFGLICAVEQVYAMRELVESRTVSALPVGGRYRVIDFTLSNMVNSGIRNVGIIANRKYNSLMDHLGSGKNWDLSRKTDGLFFLTPFSQTDNSGSYTGMLDALKSSMTYIKRAQQEYCILTGSYTLYNSTYDEMMKRHIESGADISVMYNTSSNERWSGERYNDMRLTMDGSGRVTSVEIDLQSSNTQAYSLETYIIRKDLLIALVEESISSGGSHFRHDIIRANLSRLKIMGFEHSGYAWRAHSVAAYFQMNMDFLDPQISRALFAGRNRILTKIKDGVPAKYVRGAKVRNSLVANGCVIEGEVENCVLFRSVYVGMGAVLRNCVILPNTDILDDAELQYTILDKNVNIRRGSRLIGSREFPHVIHKGAVV